MAFKLNTKQLQAFQLLNDRKNIFITGSAGTGKSFIIKKFFEEYCKKYNLPSRNSSIVKTSTTGCSAVLIGGTTLHSYLGIGTGEKSPLEMIRFIRMNKSLKDRWIELKVLIIDEVSMMDADLFDKLEEMARKIRRIESKFGGIQLILSGDFYQLPFIQNKEKTKRFCFQSMLWNIIIDKTINLTDIIRQDNNDFQRVLSKIRIGIVDEDVNKILSSRVNVTLDKKNGIVPTKLYSRRNDVDEINQKKLKKLIEKGNEFITNEAITSINKPLRSKADLDKYIDRIFKSSQFSKNFKCTIGSQVMTLINDKNFNYANGSRGIIKSYNKVKEEFEIQLLDGKTIFVQKHVWEYPISDTRTITIKQFPLKLAWAITIHKSQGMTIDYLETSIGSSIFEYHQVYVVLSRAKSLEGLKIRTYDPSKIKVNPIVTEYYENLK